MPKKASYWDYIRVEELLQLQAGVDASEQDLSDDEVRFIVIHQVDELWFKLVLQELAAARDLFAKPHVPEDALAGAVQSLKRVTICFELAAQHFRLMETMRTQDYLTFRDKLNPASGFQSAQMREIEVLMGLDDADRIPFGKEGSYLDALKSHDGTPSPAHARVTRRIADTPTLKDAVRGWLHRTPIQGSLPSDDGDDAVVAGWIEGYYLGHEQLHECALQYAVRAQALAPEDEARLRDRYDGQLRGARRHLEAEDAPETQRTFLQRLRAAHEDLLAEVQALRNAQWEGGQHPGIPTHVAALEGQLASCREQQAAASAATLAASATLERVGLPRGEFRCAVKGARRSVPAGSCPCPPRGRPLLRPSGWV